MCGRYVLKSREAHLAKALGLVEEFSELPRRFPRFNIAPTQRAPVIVTGAGGLREMRMMQWGLIPHWAKDPTIGNRLINARAETIDTKPAFRDAYRHRRCLIPADGFYEWKRVGKGKQPYYIHRRDNEPFAFAGLWETWTDPQNTSVESFTIITTKPNELVRPIHDRMPAIVTPDRVAAWLDGDDNTAAQLLRPLDADTLRAEAVSTRVNSPAYDDSTLIEPIEPTGPPHGGLF